MKSSENLINSKSEYYISTPGSIAKDLFFYPQSIGHFIYEPGYDLFRQNYNSYLLIFVQSGTLYFSNAKDLRASSGQIALLNCYEPHRYYTDTQTSCYWLHFDGPMAFEYFKKISILHCYNNPVIIDCNIRATSNIKSLYDSFANNELIPDASLSLSITTILTEFFSNKVANDRLSDIISKSRNYISANFAMELNDQQLAEKSGFSTFHFIRLFKERVGMTPHEYLMSVRLDNACYMLKNTTDSITDICYKCGYQSPSVFSTAFKKSLGCTPKDYRKRNIV